MFHLRINYEFFIFNRYCRSNSFTITQLFSLAIGLALALIHLISIPVTNTSVNPAKRTGPALLVGGWAHQLWLFWFIPLLSGSIFRYIW